MPATLAPPVPKPRAAKQRAVALALYLGQLRSPSAGTGPASSIIAELRADSWIRSQIDRNCPTATGETAVIPELVAHGCAFLAKSHADEESLNDSAALDKNNLYMLQAELMLDAAIGTALLRELQPAVEEAVKAGDMAQAKGLTEFGHRLRNGIASAQLFIGEIECRDADRLADAMTEQPREDVPAVATLDHVAREICDEYDRAKHRGRIRRQILSQVRLPSRTEMLTLMLACSLLLWVGLAKLPQVLDRGPQLIEAGDFPVTSVREVVARPPSLYVTLDSSSWDSADATARHSILAAVVSVLMVWDDYRGALVRTTDGRPVAAWTRGTGISLLEPVEPLGDPADAEKATVFVP